MTTENNNDDRDDGSPDHLHLGSGKRRLKKSPETESDVAGGGTGAAGENQPTSPTPTPGKSNQRHSSGGINASTTTTPGETEQSEGTASSTKRSAKKNKQMIPGRWGHEDRTALPSFSFGEKIERAAAAASPTSGAVGGGTNMANMTAQQQGLAGAAPDGGTPGGMPTEQKKSRNDVDRFDRNLYAGATTMAKAKVQHGHALTEQSRLLRGGGDDDGGGDGGMIPFLGTPMQGSAPVTKAPHTPSSPNSAARTPANSSSANLKRLRSAVAPSSDSSNSNGSVERYSLQNKKEWMKTWDQELELREMMEGTGENGTGPKANLDFGEEADDAKKKADDDFDDDDDDDDNKVSENDADGGKEMGGGGEAKLAAARGGGDEEVVGSRYVWCICVVYSHGHVIRRTCYLCIIR